MRLPAHASCSVAILWTHTVQLEDLMHDPWTPWGEDRKDDLDVLSLTTDYDNYTPIVTTSVIFTISDMLCDICVSGVLVTF